MRHRYTSFKPVDRGICLTSGCVVALLSWSPQTGIIIPAGKCAVGNLRGLSPLFTRAVDFRDDVTIHDGHLSTFGCFMRKCDPAHADRKLHKRACDQRNSRHRVVLVSLRCRLTWAKSHKRFSTPVPRPAAPMQRSLDAATPRGAGKQILLAVCTNAFPKNWASADGQRP